MSPVSGKNTDAAEAFAPPIKQFWGEIVDINDVSKPQRADASKNNNFVKFDMANIEIIEATEPYTFPTFSIEVIYIQRPNTQWDAWTGSVRKCGYSGDINGLIGKRARWVYRTAKINGRIPDSNPVAYGLQDQNCWHIDEIEGVENTSNVLMDSVVNLADSKNATEFKTAFLSDNSIRTLTGYSDMVTMVMNNTILDTLVAGGKLSLDGDVYKAV